MHAQKLRVLLFTIISFIGVFMPWLSLLTEKTKEAEAALVAGEVVLSIIRIVFIVLLLIAIILGAVGNKAKPLGVVKAIFTTLIGLAIGLLSFKYTGDFGGQQYVGPGIGLYTMAFGGIMMAVVSIVPTKILPFCILHKLISPPKEAVTAETEAE